jgi:hypothetical protein
MGLFFEVLNAINDPNRQGSVEQLGSVAKAVEGLGGAQGLNPDVAQTVMSMLGGQVKSALQQQGGSSGMGDLLGQVAGGNLAGMVGQAAAGGAGLAGLQAMFPPQMQQQIAQGIAQKTGLNAQTIQGMLPTLIPAVMGLLNMGSTKPGVPGGNPILNAFLDSDKDGDTDLGDVMKFAGRFLHPPA